MNRKVEKTIIKGITAFFIFLIIITASNKQMILFPIIKTAFASDITFDSNNNTYLKLITPIPEPEPPEPPEPPIPPGPPSPPIYRTEPIINWYDFQAITKESMLNSKIDVNKEYNFCINITSHQGWDDIEFIDIHAWFDQGDDSIIYNQTKGGNINIFLRYENVTGNASYQMLWPDDEITLGNFEEMIEKDSNSNLNESEYGNLTFSLIPGFQLRYAPGDGSWDRTKNEINDIWSWNFEISVIDSGEQDSNPKTTSIIDEFGINSYTEIKSVGIPIIQGLPGENASASQNITIETHSNIDYSLSVDVDSLIHMKHPSANMSNKTVWVKGGDLSQYNNFGSNNTIYLYGSSTSFIEADDNNTVKITENVSYKCDIPYGQIPGNYIANVYYKLEK